MIARRRLPVAIWQGVHHRSLHASTALFNNPTVKLDEEILATLKEELKKAMKAKDSFSSTVFRSILSEHQYAAKGSASDASVSSLVQKAIAKRSESSKAYRQGKRPDLAEKEDQEATILQKLLPTPMTSDQLTGEILAAVKDGMQSGVTGKKLIKHAMDFIHQRFDKARAPGHLIAKAVNEHLQKEAKEKA